MLYVKLGVLLLVFGVAWGNNKAEIYAVNKDVARVEVLFKEQKQHQDNYYERFYKMEEKLDMLSTSMRRDLQEIKEEIKAFRERP